MAKKIISRILTTVYDDGSSYTEQLPIPIDNEREDKNKEIETNDVSQKAVQVIKVLKRLTKLLYDEKLINSNNLTNNLINIYLNKVISDTSEELSITRNSVADKLYRKNNINKEEFLNLLLDFFNNCSKENLDDNQLKKVLLENVSKVNAGDTNYINKNFLSLLKEMERI